MVVNEAVRGNWRFDPACGFKAALDSTSAGFAASPLMAQKQSSVGPQVC